MSQEAYADAITELYEEDRRGSGECRMSKRWAPFFGLRESEMKSQSKVCRALTKVVPVAFRLGYELRKMVNRGAYGIVFMGTRVREIGGREAQDLPDTVAIKMQFVCPKRVKNWREGCAGYGQRAIHYDVAKYESLMHRRVYEAMEAARVVAAGSELVPVVPRPVKAQRTIIGKHGQFPDVPPDGRRRMWVSVSEYVSGLSLRDWMYSAKDGGRLTGELFESTVEYAMQYIRRFHDLGFFHGDLHTGNILIDAHKMERAQDWLYIIDLERSIPVSYLREEPKYAEDPALAADVLVALRFWDFKVFVESVVSLAESCRVGGGRVPEPWVETNPAAAAAVPPATDEEKRFERGVALGIRILGTYSGRDYSQNAAIRNLVRGWVIRSFYIKRNATVLPPAIQQQMSLRTAVIRDGEQKDHFFRTLRESRAFHLAVAVSED
jgi:serine/threonine protein kinase